MWIFERSGPGVSAVVRARSGGRAARSRDPTRSWVRSPASLSVDDAVSSSSCHRRDSSAQSWVRVPPIATIPRAVMTSSSYMQRGAEGLGRVRVGVRVRVKARVDDQQLVAAEGLGRGW